MAPAARAVRPAPPGRQRGAIGLFGILTLLLALLFTALAVDAGRLWFERRELQAVADLAALEAARNLGCGGDPGNVVAAAQAAAARNGFPGDLTELPNKVEVGGLTTAAGSNPLAGLRLFTAGTATDAVHVVATESVPASLVLGGFFGQETTILAEATARAEPSHATFSAGSYLLRASTTTEDANLLNLLLGGMLGSSLSLDAVSYQGLASTEVSLAQLVRAQGSVGSVEGLLALDNLSVADVIGLTASAVALQGAVDASVSAGLQTLLSAAVTNASVSLGDVLDVSVPASDAAGKVGINVLDLITTTILLANKQHAVSLPLAVNLGSLINVDAVVNVIQPPQIAVGPPGQDADGNWCAQATTAQVEVNARVQADLIVASLDLALGTTLAQGSAHLVTLDTVPGATRAVIDATPGIAALSLTNAANSGPATLTALGIPVSIGLDLPIETADGSELAYDVASPVADHLPMSQSIAAPLGNSLATALANPSAVHLNLPLLGGVLNGILSPLLGSVVSPLLGFIGGALLDPLLKLLGLQLGGLDVTVTDIEYTGGAQLVI